MKYLLVVAHPDDEVLGAGASMWKWSHEGDEVEVAIMCTEAKARAFRPSDAELEGAEAKCKALAMYRGVMRPYPHPRSNEYLMGLAAVRGSQWGCNYAEAFQVVLRRY